MAVALTPNEQHALVVASRHLKAEELRHKLKVGKFPVDITVKVQGVLEVAQDTKAFSSTNPPLTDMLAYVMGLMTKKARKQVFDNLPMMYAKNDFKVPSPDDDTIIMDIETLLITMRESKGQTERRGAVKGAFVVTRV